MNKAIYFYPLMALSILLWAAIIWAAVKFGPLIPVSLLVIFGLLFYSELKQEMKRIDEDGLFAR